MKLRKSLIALAVSGAIAAPSLMAAETTFSVSGNLRVEATSNTVGDVETLETSFGGTEETSTTGGDTSFRLNFGYVSDDELTTGGGSIRFASDRVMRINVRAASESDTYAASMFSEWEQLGLVGADGTGGVSRTDRDQFVILTHKGSGVYYKIGREEWFDGSKGFTTDFLSQAKALGRTPNGSARFSGHKLGWSNGDIGLDVGLFLQRDNHAGGAETLVGFSTNNSRADTLDVNSAGLIVQYAKGPVDVEFISVTGTATASADRGDAEYEEEVAVTQLNLGVPLGFITPFLNFSSTTKTDDVTGEASESIYSGNSLGASISFGFSDLVVAVGTGTAEDPAGVETASSGFDLMFATNQAPLLVSLAFTSGSEEVGDEDSVDTAKYGVRLDYGF